MPSEHGFISKREWQARQQAEAQAEQAAKSARHARKYLAFSSCRDAVTAVLVDYSNTGELSAIVTEEDDLPGWRVRPRITGSDEALVLAWIEYDEPLNHLSVQYWAQAREEPVKTNAAHLQDAIGEAAGLPVERVDQPRRWRPV